MKYIKPNKYNKRWIECIKALDILNAERGYFYIINNNCIVDIIFHPCSTLRDIRENYSWTNRFISKRSGLPLFVVKRLIVGKLDITEEIADNLSKLFGGELKKFWLNLQDSYNTKLNKYKDKGYTIKVSW